MLIVTCALFASLVLSPSALIKPSEAISQNNDGSALASKFEVISIRPTDANARVRSYWDVNPGGDLRAHGVTVLGLIETAYRLHSFQITGYPKWVAWSTFDIDAKASSEKRVPSMPPAVAKQQVALCLRDLLATRFALRVHHDTANRLACSLAMANNGVRLKEGSSDAGVSTYVLTRTGIVAHSISMADFANIIADRLNAVVTDDTHLEGRYDFEIAWSTEPLDSGQDPLSNLHPQEQPDAGAIAHALKDQLGIQLTSKRQPVDILVVDHVSRPTPN